jgi:aspartate-semialdehyde dehydrogenase
VASAAGPALAWALVLAPLERAAGVHRVVGTVLEAVSGYGLRGIESLHAETVALLSQQALPDPSVFPQAVAFDCLPRVGELDADGQTPREHALARDVRRLIGDHVRVAASVVQVPTFTGDGSFLAVETAREISVNDVLAAYEKAPGVALVEGDPEPTTRSTAGRSEVLIGRLRADPSSERGVLLWIASDTLRLAASNAVKLAETRIRAN